MEVLRRLRFIWACSCLVAFAVVAVSAAGNLLTDRPQPFAPFWLAAALCGACTFYLNGLLKQLSVFWLGGCGLTTLGALLMVMDSRAAVLQTVAVFGGTWAAVVVVGWVLRPVAASWAQRQGKL